MRNLIGGVCLTLLVAVMAPEVRAQVVEVQAGARNARGATVVADRDNWRRGEWRGDHDTYWNGYWNWYDGSYRPYYQQSYRYNQYYNPGYGYYDGYYGRPYGYGGRYYGTPNAGYYDRPAGGGAVRVGPLQFGWR
jgi:hypothetical protein